MHSILFRQFLVGFRSHRATYYPRIFLKSLNSMWLYPLFYLKINLALTAKCLKCVCLFLRISP